MRIHLIFGSSTQGLTRGGIRVKDSGSLTNPARRTGYEKPAWAYHTCKTAAQAYRRCNVLENLHCHSHLVGEDANIETLDTRQTHAHTRQVQPTNVQTQTAHRERIEQACICLEEVTTQRVLG